MSTMCVAHGFRAMEFLHQFPHPTQLHARSTQATRRPWRLYLCSSVEGLQPPATDQRRQPVCTVRQTALCRGLSRECRYSQSATSVPTLCAAGCFGAVVCGGGTSMQRRQAGAGLGVVGTTACSGAAAATSTARALCHCKTPLMTGRVGPNKPRCWGCSVVENDAGVLALVCSSGSCCRLS